MNSKNFNLQEKYINEQIILPLNNHNNNLKNFSNNNNIFIVDNLKNFVQYGGKGKGNAKTKGMANKGKNKGQSKGRKLKNKMKQKAKELKKKMKEKAKEMKEKAKEKAEELKEKAKEKAEELKERGKEKLEEMRASRESSQQSSEGYSSNSPSSNSYGDMGAMGQAGMSEIDTSRIDNLEREIMEIKNKTPQGINLNIDDFKDQIELMKIEVENMKGALHRGVFDRLKLIRKEIEQLKLLGSGNKSELERLRLLPVISDPNILTKSQNKQTVPSTTNDNDKNIGINNTKIEELKKELETLKSSINTDTIEKINKLKTDIDSIKDNMTKMQKTSVPSKKSEPVIDFKDILESKLSNDPTFLR